jgi:hypothetical protein
MRRRCNRKGAFRLLSRVELRERDRAVVAVAAEGGGLLRRVCHQPQRPEARADEDRQLGDCAQAELAVVRERPEDGLELGCPADRAQPARGNDLPARPPVRRCAAAGGEGAACDLVDPPAGLDAVADAEALSDSVLDARDLAAGEHERAAQAQPSLEDGRHRRLVEQQVALGKRGVGREQRRQAHASSATLSTPFS